MNWFLLYLCVCVLAGIITVIYLRSLHNRHEIFCPFCGELLFDGLDHFCEERISSINEPKRPGSIIGKTALYIKCKCGKRKFYTWIYSHQKFFIKLETEIMVEKCDECNKKN